MPSACGSAQVHACKPNMPVCHVLLLLLCSCPLTWVVLRARRCTLTQRARSGHSACRRSQTGAHGRVRGTLCRTVMLHVHADLQHLLPAAGLMCACLWAAGTASHPGAHAHAIRVCCMKAVASCACCSCLLLQVPAECE